MWNQLSFKISWSHLLKIKKKTCSRNLVSSASRSLCLPVTYLILSYRLLFSLGILTKEINTTKNYIHTFYNACIHMSLFLASKQFRLSWNLNGQIDLHLYLFIIFSSAFFFRNNCAF